ncbi:hypothetical protein FS763_14455 [Agrobacterium vitis]|uniref:hypothetical protein n=1 Tax=Allorhizobium ampelinum TaxID=3025782 RepID=UPI001F328C33|nr:hypothetical protein [Allorhizobium ampelinum]MCF1473141.1 hypothetical protein [Allorhizobium ampelinum]
MSWVSDGEKFALLGLNIDMVESLPALKLPQGYSILQNRFVLPEHWKEWLGSTRVEEVEECSVYLVVTMQAKQPDVIDDDNLKLKKLINHWYFGLLLTDKFVNISNPFIAIGVRQRGEIDVLEFQPFEAAGSGIVEHYPAVSGGHLERAINIAKTLESLASTGGVSNWRLLRCLAIYRDARIKTDLLDRLHQFVRCIDGLIVSEPGRGKQQFKGRTELFIGSIHQAFMGELFDLRSHIEHLHENLHLEIFDRDVRIEIARKEAVSEFIARTCLLQILESPDLCLHFGNVEALRAFWQIEQSERREIWGPPVDPYSVLKGFSFEHVSDQDLGKSY